MTPFNYDPIWYLPEMAQLYNEWLDLCEASLQAKNRLFIDDTVDNRIACNKARNELLISTRKIGRRYTELKQADEVQSPSAE